MLCGAWMIGGPCLHVLVRRRRGQRTTFWLRPRLRSVLGLVMTLRLPVTQRTVSSAHFDNLALL